ncbi:myo-inositol-1(or 4)-monophosphatase [Marchantia polymorpha subsp. ruderalis]
MTQVIGGSPMRLCAASWRSPGFVSRTQTVVSISVQRNVRPGRLVTRAVQTVQVDISQEIKDIEAVAVRLAREAGALILAKSGRATQVDRKASRSDLVTEVDKACEHLIQSEVKAVFPQHHWLGEETFTEAQLDRLGDGPKGADYTWLVDPIDGTLNFIGGLPFASVSIAVARGSTLQVGVVYNPFIDELFTARKGEGAYLNGESISALPRETELEDAIVTLGFNSKPERRKLMLQEISKVGPHCRAIRALGSAALHISYIAAGRVGCFFEHGLKPWDIAAAWLILEEAGGYVTQMNGEPLPLVGGSILATNGGKVHERMIEILN